MTPKVGKFVLQVAPNQLELPDTPVAGTDAIYLNDLRLYRRSSGSPGLNEYTIAGNLVTLGMNVDLGGADVAWADYFVP